jgi:hypothetical protein
VKRPTPSEGRQQPAARGQARGGAARPRRSAARLTLLTVAAGAVACTGSVSHRTVAMGGTAGAAVAVEAADKEWQAGHQREAMARYEAVVRQYPADPAAAEALHDLAMLHLEPGSPLRDRRAAQALLRRLATDYPSSQWGHEARAWRVLLRELDRCEVEATRRGADAEKLRQTLDAIKDSDLELEQHQ